MSYEKLIQSFLRLSHANSGIVNEDRILLKKYTEDMANFCEAIRNKYVPGQNFILRGQDRALRDFADIIVKISFSVTKDLQK